MEITIIALVFIGLFILSYLIKPVLDRIVKAEDDYIKSRMHESEGYDK